MVDIQEPEYVSLEHLAASLRLPKKRLRDLADAGDIPALRLGSRLRFHIPAVREALRELARRPARSTPTPSAPAPAPAPARGYRSILYGETAA